MTFYVDGRLPQPNSDDFAAALATHRFRTIETAASEEVSIGWVTAGDPTGDTFEAEDMDLDAAGVWLRVRIDKKKLPTAWLQIHRAVAERSAGRALSARERRDLKDDLCDKILPRTLPSVQFIDALWRPKQQRLVLFTTSNSVREEFEKLFFKTFAVAPEPASPYSLATHAGLDREQLAYLEEVSPVPWPRAGGRRTAAPLPVADPVAATESAEPDPENPDPAELEAEEMAAVAAAEPEFGAGVDTDPDDDQKTGDAS